MRETLKRIFRFCLSWDDYISYELWKFRPTTFSEKELYISFFMMGLGVSKGVVDNVFFCSMFAIKIL